MKFIGNRGRFIVVGRAAPVELCRCWRGGARTMVESVAHRADQVGPALSDGLENSLNVGVVGHERSAEKEMGSNSNRSA